MRLMNFYADASKKKVHVGLVIDQGIVDINKASAQKGMELPCECGNCESHGSLLSMEKIIAAGEAGRAFVQKAAEGQPALQEESLVHAPAVTNPEKIICVAVNYHAHIDEMNSEKPDAPVLFSKFRTALTPHNGTVHIPKAGGNIDYEAELVVVIGREAKEVTPEEAMDYVYGYTIGNDISMRKRFSNMTSWILGKSPDGFGPVGPHIVTKEELDCSNLAIKLYRNGVLKQNSNTSLMIVDVPHVISFASSFFTLKPGDIIYTGTPSGVIMGKDTNDPFLEAGEELVVEIEGLGKLRNVMA